MRSLDGIDTLLLDRDGVLNRLRPGDYVKTWNEFEWLPGALEALADAAGRFPRIYIVSNQRGVGRGVMTQEALDDVHRRMMADVTGAGGRIDGIYVSTAVSDEDPSRKPGRGLFDAILREHADVAAERTAMIGDSPSDMAFAANCGIRGIWCRSEK
ncbi:MAG: HAD-IIIA family hydrolase [Bacteroidales bacterium]|nr:HAD-IIIA family hydrolase [Bacteroidales bacterium]